MLTLTHFIYLLLILIDNCSGRKAEMMIIPCKDLKFWREARGEESYCSCRKIMEEWFYKNNVYRVFLQSNSTPLPFFLTSDNCLLNWGIRRGKNRNHITGKKYHRTLMFENDFIHQDLVVICSSYLVGFLFNK